MQDIDPAGELGGVDGPEGVTLVVLDHLQHAGRTETRHDLGILVLAASLGQVDAWPKKVFDILLHPIEVALAELTHLIGLRADFDIALIMPILTYFSQLAMSRTLGSRPRNLRVRAILNRWQQHPKSRKTHQAPC